MSLTGKDIAEIARLLDASHFTSLDLSQGEFRLRIRRDGASDGSGAGNWSNDEPEEISQPVTKTQAHSPAPAPVAAAPSAGKGEVDIAAPLIGNFYSAPRPGEPPFVKVGDTITQDTVVAIIEVMKLMNSVRAGVSGTVSAMLAENGSAVEEGQPIIRVKAN